MKRPSILFLSFFLGHSLGAVFSQPLWSDSLNSHQNKSLDQNDTVIRSTLTETISDSMPAEDYFFYDSLRARTQKSWTKYIMDAMIIEPRGKSDSADFTTNLSSFRRFNGKRAAHIRFMQVDIFSGDVDDTSRIIFGTTITDLLSKLHHQTRKVTLEKNLLFKVGDKITAYMLSDNERLLRSLPYIEDARIFADICPADTNKVNITIVTRDVYSIGFSAAVNSLKDFHFTLFDRNFLGLGWTLQGTYFYNNCMDPKHGLEFEYRNENIKGTFITGLFRYRKYAESEQSLVEFNRNFMTPETKYGGGIAAEMTHSRVSVFSADTLKIMPATSNDQDLWFGRQFLLKKNHARRNLVLACRLMRREYTFRPPVSPDENEIFHHSLTGLGSLMLTRTNYFQSNMILEFGRTEDVPVGFLFKITAGRKWMEFESGYYSGLSVAGAHIFTNIGYFSGKAEYGSLYNDTKNKESIIKTHLMHFTPLIHLGDYKIRNFIRSDYIIGLELRDDSAIYLTDNYGVRGLPETGFRGKQRLNINWETVTFTPWQLYGFKFVFYGFTDIGCIGNSEKFINFEKTYSGFGLGLRIRNESLVFKTLQLRFAYYPHVPNGAAHTIFNISSRERPVFENFSGAKPEIISFR
ncbi:MAG: hypothetical protein JXB44_15500 [Calditrichaceae bacterium]|nr:hypothetical protein [Calditrichaceae bacterium]RQV92133.1 MAG: hypothetical protein EH224_16450 [Calditrichota bacterium]